MCSAPVLQSAPDMLSVIAASFPCSTPEIVAVKASVSPAASRGSGSAGSCADRAVLVVLEPEYDAPLDPPHDGVQPDAHHGEHDQDREHAGHVHAEIALQDEVAEAGLRADELADDRADDRQHDRDVEPDQYVGQGLAHAQLPE